MCHPFIDAAILPLASKTRQRKDTTVSDNYAHIVALLLSFVNTFADIFCYFTTIPCFFDKFRHRLPHPLVELTKSVQYVILYTAVYTKNRKTDQVRMIVEVLPEKVKFFRFYVKKTVHYDFGVF